MTTEQHVHEYIIPAAMAFLPPPMDTPEARAMLLSIGSQESGFVHRKQVGNAIARGWYQFERMGGVIGVLTHPTTRPLITPVLRVLRYEANENACYDAITDNDVLATVFARLLLWTVPAPLPRRGDAAEGWRQYLSAWRPGRPHKETWDAHFTHAWETVGA